MSLVSLEAPAQIARRSVIGLIVILGLLSLGFIDQSVHWLIEFIGNRYEVPTESRNHPGLWFFFSIFFAAASVFGSTLLFFRSGDYARTHRGLILASTWALASAMVWLIIFNLPGQTHALAPLDTTLFVLDQIARGAFFDLFEVMGWSLTRLGSDFGMGSGLWPWWLGITLVIFRTMTSVGSVVVLVRLLGLRSHAFDPD